MHATCTHLSITLSLSLSAWTYLSPGGMHMSLYVCVTDLQPQQSATLQSLFTITSVTSHSFILSRSETDDGCQVQSSVLSESLP